MNAVDASLALNRMVRFRFANIDFEGDPDSIEGAEYRTPLGHKYVLKTEEFINRKMYKLGFQWPGPNKQPEWIHAADSPFEARMAMLRDIRTRLLKGMLDDCVEELNNG